MRTIRLASAVLPLLSIVATMPGCGASPASPPVGESESVSAAVEFTSLVQKELSVGSLLAVNGTYGAGCVARSGSWSAVASGGSGPYAPLTVVKNNTACQLTVTSITADQFYVGAPTFVLTTSYQSTASAFAPVVDGASGSTAFYGNAELSAASFASNFVISILYSDNPSSVAGGSTASYASVTASATGTSVSSPNYTIDPSGLALQVDVNNIVQSATGQTTVIASTITGQGYVIDLGTLPASPTFANLDATYKAGTATLLTGGNFAVMASALGVIGVNLTTPAVRTIIIANTSSGVTSYEAVALTFSHP
jgi:hypothetical protein